MIIFVITGLLSILVFKSLTKDDDSGGAERRTNSSDSRKAKAMLTMSRIVVYAILVFLSVLCVHFSVQVYHQGRYRRKRQRLNIRNGLRSVPFFVLFRRRKEKVRFLR